jgi:cyclophilin family peptidyl-prolyl cis-trans isomerase
MKRTLILALVGGLLAAAPVKAANPVVVIETSMGNIKVELNEEKAPVTVKNFLMYVDDKFYDGTIFHRVIGKENSDKGNDFMIQGGGLTPGFKEKKTKDPIKLESDKGLSNLRGTIAMARTNDPDSATSQFFINVADNKFLDKADGRDGYAVFGKVIAGMDIVDKIKAVETTGDNGDPANAPKKDIVIKKIYRDKKGSDTKDKKEEKDKKGDKKDAKKDEAKKDKN